jgi:hypothetical protein
MAHVEDVSASVSSHEASAPPGSACSRTRRTRSGRGVVELNSKAEQPLDQLEEGLLERDVTIARPMADEAFGRQLQLTTRTDHW